MNWAELSPVIGFVGLAVGIVCGIIGLMGKRPLQKRLDALQDQRDEGDAGRARDIARLAGAEAELKASRDVRRQLDQRAELYFEEGKKEYLLRKALQKRLAELTAQLEQFERQLAETVEQRIIVDRECADLRIERNGLEAAVAKARKQMARVRQRLAVQEDQIEAVNRQDGRVWEAPVPLHAPEFVPLAVRRVPIVSILNLKGGVGKTTITANLGGFLGSTGKRVLVVDLDHQRSLSQMLLPSADRERVADQGRTIQHFLQSETRDGPAFAATAEKVPSAANCWLISNADPKAGHSLRQGLDDLEMQLLGRWLIARPGGEDVRFLFRAALHSEVVRDHFDVVLFDCPPRLTTACVNALAASDAILIPVQPETVAMRSVQHLLHRLKGLRESGVLSESVALGVVANLVPERGAAAASDEAGLFHRAAQAALRTWGQPIRFFDTKLTRHLHYVDATRSLETENKLKLAIRYKAIRVKFEELADELEGLIHADLGVARVPS